MASVMPERYGVAEAPEYGARPRVALAEPCGNSLFAGTSALLADRPAADGKLWRRWYGGCKTSAEVLNRPTETYR
jgi:hypothetical protein